MLVSVAWIKSLLPGLPGAAEVARVLTARGLTVDAIANAGADVVLDVDVPANRPDALGHLGVAREIAAGLGIPFQPVYEAPAGSGAPATAAVRVAIDDEDLCRRYTAGLVRGVRVGPSPEWVVARLEACGLRSINNVVDASNLVLLELGQPVHFFDLARLSGPEIRIRRAAEGEVLVSLDGGERRLAPDMLVIADDRRPVALAGVMGGADSEIGETTSDVLIEAAWFLPGSVRRTARRLGMSTEASQRFERGCDPEAPLAAQHLSMRLLMELCGGTAAPGVVDLYPGRRAPARLSVRLERAATLLGYAPARNEARRALEAVGCRIAAADATSFEVEPPSWRVDLEREADLVEEIGRHIGYDRIPTASIPLAPAGTGVPSDADEERVRDRLAALGFHEAFSYAMIGPGEDAGFAADDDPAPLALTNPISESLGWLRRSLLPALAAAAAANLRRGVDDVRLFEAGRVFLPTGRGAFPREPMRVGIAWAGAATPRHWSAPARPLDLWDIAGAVEAVLHLLRPQGAFERGRSARTCFQPGRSITWAGPAGATVAWCGQLDPAVAAALEAPGPIYLAEVDLDAVATLPRVLPQHRPVPRVPASWRDLSLLCAAGVEAGAVLAALSAVPSPAPASFEVVDRFEGAPLREGEVSLTVRVILRPLERTLEDAVTESYRTALVLALDRVPGVKMRAGA
ncbi:MAG TPA: phenylalanine--tRNA ligase subunit beta [Candidatus Polarisedimenticolaceae bacterium]